MVPGRVPVLAGAAEASVRETLQACETYAGYGARAVAIVSPFYYRLAPDFLDKCAAYAIENAKKSGATDAAIVAKTKEMAEFSEMYKNPLFNVAITFLEPLPVGVVFSLVTAVVFGRRRQS